MKFNNKKPLVSICATFLNSEKYIHRFLESSLNQTYKNIEVVLVDDASTDDSQRIIAEYALHDKRIRYFRNPEKLGIIPGLKRAYELAEGEFVIWLGTDDWLTRNSIERGVRSFLRYPDSSAVMPRVISLREIDKEKFDFIMDASVPSGIYSAEWIAKQTYRGFLSASCLFALFRKEDALSAINYFLKNCCYSPDFPEELREITLKKAYAPDFIFFLEILTRYKNCVSDDSFIIMKITHSSNLTFKNLEFSSASNVLKSEYYGLLFFKSIYKYKYPNFYSRMKIYTGAQSLATFFIYFLRSGLRPSFFDIKENRKVISEYFKDFSIIERVLVTSLLIPRIISRLFGFLGRSAKKDDLKLKESQVFVKENFLDRDGYFKV
ncbi:MAG: glycosyltransferase family 2 protein [Patescibacteria group bacterium]